jgi:hypothetical protein
MRNLFKIGSIVLIIFVVIGCSRKKPEEPVAAAPTAEEVKLYEVVVERIVMEELSGVGKTPVIILANKENTSQLLPIWVGMSEGISIDMALKESKPSRPGTHDLFADTLGQFKIKLIKVVITDLNRDTYIAEMTVELDGEIKKIDARPSDSIAMALRLKAPIYVSELVIQKGSWMKSPGQGRRWRLDDTKKDDNNMI